MTTTTVFINNRSQAVRLPVDVRLPENVKKVTIRVKGNERIIAPAGQSWESFFLGTQKVTDDFMEERDDQEQSEREAL
ncbi:MULTISPECIES: type II toxin-antitoxin system VapB family antitoxin [Chlorobium]|uniref:SpoVT/AbrB-like n=1 Tax=Chlorobium ferrooxidans DSM 13031 TaxID=377431 RepID=Q0YSR4_9CHLB|nr:MULTISPECIES: AbrB/MazE/SpoVT family DNA-binding domain-containing protein [Chlorobium]EAT59329.1 SpoVT/AbrB-like [Chlorobium ferrooxidans DSM 13031]